MSFNTMATIRRLLIERGITDVLVVDSECSINVGTQGHVDYEINGMKATEILFDKLTCKTIQCNTPTKPYYTQLMGRWGQ